MLSVTEERLRSFVDKLTSALTENVDVQIVPSDAWAATPNSKPPKLLYRVADVAVIGDKILAVTGHEIGHLLYTDEYEYKFDVSKKPKAAHQLLNVVEDARIEREFARKYPGAGSLFTDLHGDGPDGSDRPFNETMRSKFHELPIKWRYLFNIDRLLHGNDLLGSEQDKQAVMDVADSLREAANASGTQACADLLEPAYKKLLEQFILGAQELKKRRDEQKQLQEALDNASQELIRRLQRPDVVSTGAFDDDLEGDEDVKQELAEHEAAESDDGKPGGKDGSPGMRQDGEGEGEDGAPGKDADANASGGTEAGEQSDPSGSGSTGAGQPTRNVGNVAGEGDVDIDAYGDREELSDEDRVKAINIFEEMLAEEKNTTNRAIIALQRHQTERAKAAGDVERKMREEAEQTATELADVFGQEEGTQLSGTLRERLQQNGEEYSRHRSELMPEITQLRTYMRSVLQDNARKRYGGSYEAGRRIKKTRLDRAARDDFRIFERKEMVDGKSYSIAVVVDQSGSMGSYSYNMNSKQQLAYRAGLVFLEASEGLARTALIGFTDFPRQRDARRRSRYRHLAPGASMPSRTYKRTDQQLQQRKFTVPMLQESLGSTPMGAGIKAGTANLRNESTEVRAIVLITDGYPSDGAAAKRAADEARRLGIPIYSVLVSDYIGSDSNAYEFLARISERVVSIQQASDIPQSVYQLLRGIVRRGGSPHATVRSA